jgi:hypothetical protein
MCFFIVTISTSAGIVFHLDLWKIKFTTTTTTGDFERKTIRFILGEIQKCPASRYLTS